MNCINNYGLYRDKKPEEFFNELESEPEKYSKFISSNFKEMSYEHLVFFRWKGLVEKNLKEWEGENHSLPTDGENHSIRDILLTNQISLPENLKSGLSDATRFLSIALVLGVFDKKVSKKRHVLIL